MANVSKSRMKSLSALIAEIEAAAYARGRADARKGLLDILAAGDGPRPRGLGSRGRQADKPAPAERHAGGRKRAPRGSVPRFVERVLRGRPGSTVREILEQAATDAERSIKLSSIRVELGNGRRQGKYTLRHRLPVGARPADLGDGHGRDRADGDAPGTGPGIAQHDEALPAGRAHPDPEAGQVPARTVYSRSRGRRRRTAASVRRVRCVMAYPPSASPTVSAAFLMMASAAWVYLRVVSGLAWPGSLAMASTLSTFFSAMLAWARHSPSSPASQHQQTPWYN